MYRHVQRMYSGLYRRDCARHVSILMSDMSIDMCIDMPIGECIDMCTDMRTGILMCRRVYRHVTNNVSPASQPYACICADMQIYVRADARADMWHL